MSPRSKAARKTSGSTSLPLHESGSSVCLVQAGRAAVSAFRAPLLRQVPDDRQVAVGGHAEQLLDGRVAEPASRGRRDDEEVGAAAVHGGQIIAVVERLESLDVGSRGLLLQERDVVGAGVAV